MFANRFRLSHMWASVRRFYSGPLKQSVNDLGFLSPVIWDVVIKAPPTVVVDFEVPPAIGEGNLHGEHLDMKLWPEQHAKVFLKLSLGETLTVEIPVNGKIVELIGNVVKCHGNGLPYEVEW